MRLFRAFPYPVVARVEFHFGELFPPELLGMERMKKTALTKAIGSILAGDREGKMEILA